MIEERSTLREWNSVRQSVLLGKINASLFLFPGSPPFLKCSKGLNASASLIKLILDGIGRIDPGNSLERMGRQLLEFNGESDPFHLLLGLPSNLVLSCFVKSFNTTPYRFLRREFASTITRVHRHKPVPWGRAYFFLKRWKASLTFVKQDIEEQEISEENGFLYLTSQGLWLKHWLPERIESHSTKKLFFCCKLTQ